MPSASDEFKSLTIEESLKRLGTDIATGLMTEEVKKRREEFGYNEVEEKKQSTAVRFLKKFWGLTAWMLEITIVLTIILGKYLDLCVITALLIFNAILGFAQEQKATNAVESLRRRLRVQARVLRDRAWSVVSAKELVPGDIVRMRVGDFVPADMKIIEGEVEVDPSALTGESLPLEERPGDILYSSSIIRRGEATGVVISIGTRTYFGRTVQLVEIARPKLHMEAVISGVVKWLLIMVGAFLSLAFMLSVIRGVNLLEMLPLALVLLASSIPVALPAMFTITMALGSLALARKGILVTRLNASEDAAMMDTLCVDKTGTITMNKLSVADVLEVGSYKKEDVLLYGALASQEANQDLIDLAFIAAARERGVRTEGYTQKKFLPFDPSTRRTEAVIESDGRQFRAVKGAVSVIAPLCSIDSHFLEREMEAFAMKAYRTIAVATDDGGSKMELVGMAALYDRPRLDSAELIAELKELGISIKMLTGDSLPIAREIAKEIGLGNNIARMTNLKEVIGFDETRAAEVVEKSDGFAEIYPEDKYLVVKCLQSKKHVVGMTGDGVNDAAALRQAEVGIAVSNATDVAKGAASAVLTSEGLSNIVDLVKTGRMIYQRIVIWILNKVIKTFQIVVFVVLAFLLTGKYIVETFDIVMLLFLLDFVTISLSTDNVRWSNEPDTWDVTNLVKVGLVLGISKVVASFGLLHIGLNYLGLSDKLPQLHTFVLDLLLFSGLFTIFVVRERGFFWKSMPSKPLLVAILGDTLLVCAISVVGVPGLVPISVSNVIIALAYSFVFFLLVIDLIKVALVQRMGGW